VLLHIERGDARDLAALVATDRWHAVQPVRPPTLPALLQRLQEVIRRERIVRARAKVPSRSADLADVGVDLDGAREVQVSGPR
jgi:hypothetical protein